MKLILFTQRVDSKDTNLGFFTQWLKIISQYCDVLIVVCWSYSGEYISDNTKIIVIKNKNKLFRALEIYFHFFRFRNEYDKIFVHMLPEIVALLLPIKLVFKKKIYLWYTHKTISNWVIIAEKIASKIFSASTESFSLKTDKLNVFGHGIVVDGSVNEKKEIKKIVTLGRISRVKSLETLIKAVKNLIESGTDVEYDIIGPCFYEDDKVYLDELKALVRNSNLQEKIRFLPAVDFQTVDSVLKNYSIFIHQCRGGLDKAPLEAMAVGLLVFSSNKSVAENLKEIDQVFVFAENDEIQLANNLKRVMLMDEKTIFDYRKKMNDQVRNNHSLEKLIAKIINTIND